MDDRELLKLAAKAARMDYLIWTPGGSPIIPGSMRAPGYKVYWNPLTDDGDALRLAVKLNLFHCPTFFHYLALERFNHQGEDDMIANRRAIVRAAAAEMGRNTAKGDGGGV